MSVHDPQQIVKQEILNQIHNKFRTIRLVPLFLRALFLILRNGILAPRFYALYWIQILDIYCTCSCLEWRWVSFHLFTFSSCRFLISVHFNVNAPFGLFVDCILQKVVKCTIVCLSGGIDSIICLPRRFKNQQVFVNLSMCHRHG
jgi:hypothetical protein